jgi:hypothetical protein
MTKAVILPNLLAIAILTAGCSGPTAPTLAIGSSPADATPGQPTTNGAKSAPQADTLLVNAINALDGRESLSARIHVNVNLFEEQMVGSGLYLEQAPSRLHRLRMEMNIQLRDEPATLLQVCDGQNLWTFRQMGQERSLTRIDVNRVVAAAAGPTGNVEAGVLPNWPGLGGLPRLLRTLRESFQFEVVEPGRLLQVPVWQIQGRWRPARLAALLPDQKKTIEQGKPVDFAKLPRQLPSHVVVVLGQEDLVPYRIEYRRVKKGDNLGALESRATVALALQLSEVALNVPLDPSCFAHHSGDMGSVDMTDEFMQATGLK